MDLERQRERERRAERKKGILCQLYILFEKSVECCCHNIWLK
jgi:hypothetical protein